MTRVMPCSRVQRGKDGDYLFAGTAVQVAGRLIGQEQRRVFHQRPGDGDTLLLAAGQLDGAVVHPVGQAYLGEVPPGLLRSMPPAYLMPSSTLASAVARGSRLNCLENKANLLAPDLGQFTVAEAADLSSFEIVVA